MAYGCYPLGWRPDCWSRANPVHRRSGGGYESHSGGKFDKSKYLKQVISNSKAKFFYLCSTYTIPVFFTQNASRAHFDFARLARVFFVPEHVNMEQAVELVKKPRYSNRVKQK
jgi:hypothetical protein